MENHNIEDIDIDTLPKNTLSHIARKIHKIAKYVIIKHSSSHTA